MRLHRSLLLAAAGVLLTAAAAQAQAGDSITAREIDAHLRFLSSDLLEGRAPATRGGRLAAEYIAGQLQQYGLQPGVNGGWFQKVPIDIVGALPGGVHATASGRATATLRYPD